MAMNDLPNELITMIADLLPMKDMLTARRTWRSSAAVGFAILQKDRNRLYLHPKRVKDVVALCKHPDISKQISEIVIIGTQRPREHNSVPAQYTLDYINGYAWPATTMANPTGLPLGPNKDNRTRTQRFANKYAVLFKALQGLKNLKTIGYDSHVTRPGWCPVSWTTMKRYAENVATFKPNVDDNGRPQPFPSWRVLRWSDSEVFWAIFFEWQSCFTEINIQSPLPLIDRTRWHLVKNLEGFEARGSQLSWIPYEEIGKGITHCTTIMPIDDHYRGFIDQLLFSMTDLQYLSVVYGSEKSRPRLLCGGVRRASRSPPAPSKKWMGRLHLRALNDFKTGTDRTSPAIKLPQLKSFLLQHKESLSNVTLTNVKFTTRKVMQEAIQESASLGSFGPHHNHVDILEDVLAVLEDDLNLDTAMVLVPRKEGPQSRARQLFPGLQSSPSIFEDLSLELGVVVDENGCWDFAKSLNLRKKDQQIESNNHKQLSHPTDEVNEDGIVVIDPASLPGDTSGLKHGSYYGIGNLDMLDVVKLLEAADITCCMVGVGALRYYGALRVLHETWEVCVPSDELQTAVQALTSPPYNDIYERCPHEPIWVRSLHHTYHFLQLKGFDVQFYLISSEDCHLDCIPSNIERSQTGLPYPKLDVLAQSLLDTREEVALTDLVDGMDLDNEWASEHLDLSGTQDIGWTRRRNQKIAMSDPDLPGFCEEPRCARTFWEEIIETRDRRIGMELPPGVPITRFRGAHSGDHRLDDRPWV